MSDPALIRENLKVRLIAAKPMLDSSVLRETLTGITGYAMAYAKTLDDGEQKAWINNDVSRLHDAIADIQQALGRAERARLSIEMILDPDEDE